MIKLGLNTETVSPTELYEVVSAASSQDPAKIQVSAKRLKEMLEMAGTYDGLHEIAAQRNVPLSVRQQSIIQFKNAALNHWRSRKLLSDEQRVRIRLRCMSFLDEEDETIAECNEVIVAKIARQDFPHNWSSLVGDLMGVIDTSLQSRYMSPNADPRMTLMIRRSLKVLNEILKEYMNVKMLTGVKTMGQLVEQLHQVLYDYYSKISAGFSSGLNPSTISQPRTAEELQFAHIIYKCIVKMAAWSWSRTDQQSDGLKSWFENLFRSSAIQLKSLNELRISLVLALRSSPTPGDPVAVRSVDQLTRHVRLFGKFFRRLQQLAVTRFIALPTCGELVMYYWSKVVQAASGPSELIADSNDAVFPVRFLVQAMVLFKESLAQWSPFRKGEPNENVLSREFVEDAVRLLVTRFIPLNPSDLETWMADPEEWVNIEDKENEQWEFELRPCGERVLMTLSLQYKQYVAPLLETTFKQVIAQPTVDLPSIIQKEALYCALGRCATRLKEVIPFDQWLEHTLVAESLETNPNYPIIKRRIAWLIGKWVGDMCSSPNNPKVWEVLVRLLSDRGPGTDTVVRLTAAVALRECIDTVDFRAEVFAPFLAPAATELVRLVAEADTLESKRRVTNSLNSVIERAETRIVPLVDTITEPLPQLWADADRDYLLKGSLLTTITKLVESAREHSAPLCRIVVPLVRESLSPGTITFLDEDALILWQAALRNTVTIQSVNGAPGLIELFPIVIMFLAENADLLGKITSIHQSYYILDASSILQGFAVDLFRAYVTALKNSPPSINMTDMYISIGQLLQLAPSSLWGEPLHTSGLFAYMMKTLIDDEKLSTSLLTEHIYIFARLAMADRNMFLQLMSATATSQNTSETLLYEGLLDGWWGKFDNMSEPRHRKLTAMGIASLVATGRSEVLQRLPTEIFNLWLDVFGEIKETQNLANHDGSSSPLQRFWDEDQPPATYFNETEDTPEYDRRNLMYNRDPVQATQLSSYVAALLREAETVCGSQAFHSMYLAKADPTVLQQIQAELIR